MMGEEREEEDLLSTISNNITVYYNTTVYK